MTSTMNKRDFVLGSVGAVASVASATAGAGQTAPASRGLSRRRPDLVEQPGTASFQAYLGEVFELADGRLLRLSEVALHPGCEHTQQFSLHFSAAGGGPGLAQPTVSGLQTLRHPPTGQTLSLFLEAAEKGRGGLETLHVAHFSLLT